MNLSWALTKIRTKLIQIIVGIIFAFLFFFANIYNEPIVSKLVNNLDAYIYDTMVVWNPIDYNELARVIIIDIDDASLSKEGRWPWPRNKLANLILKLKEDGVVVIGIDIIMSDPEINYANGLKSRISEKTSTITTTEFTQLNSLLDKVAPIVDNDQALANAISEYDVALGFLFHELSSVKIGVLPQALKTENGEILHPKEYKVQLFHGYNASLGLLTKASNHGGFVTNLPDFDGVLRHGLLLGSINDQVYPSLPLMTVMRYQLADYVNFKFKRSWGGLHLYGLDVGGTFVPTNANGQILMPFWGPQFSLPYYSASDVMHGHVNTKELEGSIAIIGSSAILLGDLHASPVAKLFPGVEMVANMVAAILGQQITTSYDWTTTHGTLLFLLFGFIVSLLFPFLRVAIMISLAILFALVILVGSIFLYSKYNIYIAVGNLLLMIGMQTIANYAFDFALEKRQKSKIKDLFGQYVPENYVQQLLTASDLVTMDGKTMDMTVLFSDIRNFTSISEHLDAPGVKRLLHTFFTPITEIIFNHHGTIDKYVGDMVIAFWGAPIPIKDNAHAFFAILTALDMIKKMPSINQHMQEIGISEIQIGIGIGTGVMNVGDMGSKFRRSYTVLGDVVNLTSRLEGLTKLYGVSILVNEETRASQDSFVWRTVDKVAVKGRESSLAIYEPLGLKDDISPEIQEELSTYHRALEHYFKQEWDLALSIFDILRTEYPKSKLYKLYWRRTMEFKTNPPPSDWDGISRHTQTYKDYQQ